MRFILFILFLAFATVLFAKDKPVYDTAAVTIRHLSSSSLDKYKNDKDFQYKTETTQAPSLWDRFWWWFWAKWAELMSTPAGRVSMNILLWVIGIGAVGFFIFKVVKMNRQSIFASDVKSQTQYSLEAEDIHAIPFEQAISEALAQGNYRLAIRLLYLRNLKTLSDKTIIAWQPNKTNAAYIREITNETLQQSFKELTRIFEYAWYGLNEIAKDDYELISEKFTQFQNQL